MIIYPQKRKKCLEMALIGLKNDFKTFRESI